MILKQSTPYLRLFLLVSSTDHITGKTGASPVVQLSKNGSAFVTAVSSPATEVGGAGNGNGWYSIQLNGVDTNGAAGSDLAFHITAAGADPTDFCDQVQLNVFSDLNVDVNGNVSVASNIKKNQALTGFSFPMTVGGLPTNGLTVSAQRSLGGAGFAPCANSVTALSTTNAIYKIDLAASDLNASSVMLRFTASGADDRDIYIITQP